MASQSSAVGRARARRMAAAATDELVLAAAAHLTSRDRRLVRAVGEHRVLATGQLAALGFGSVITARHRLAVLVRLAVLRRFRPYRETGSAPWHYLLGPVGAALLGAEDADEKRWVAAVRADRQLALEALVAEVRITDHGLIPVFRIPSSRPSVSGDTNSAAAEPAVRTMLRWVGLTCQHPNPGWLVDGPEIMIRAVRKRCL
jgi:Replication-relaxation